MRKHIQIGILTAEALLCVFLAASPAVLTGTFASVMAFPFAQIGDFLRLLSLSGGTGNVVAIVLYVLVALSPLLLLLLRKNRNLQLEDALIPLLSLLFFWVLYLMINPGSIPLAGGVSFGEGMAVKKAVLGGAVYTVLIGYLILRLLRRFYKSGEEQALRDLSCFLFFLNMALVAAIFGSGVSTLLETFRTIPVSNSALPQLFPINYIFTVLRFLVDSLPYALNILIIFSAATLLQNLREDRYAEATVSSAKSLAKACGGSLVLMLCSSIALQLLQLLFSAQLFDVNNAVSLPLFSIALTLICLLLTQLVKEGKALKDENDSFI